MKNLYVQVNQAYVIKVHLLEGFNSSGGWWLKPNNNSLNLHFAKAKDLGCKFSAFNQSPKT